MSEDLPPPVEPGGGGDDQLEILIKNGIRCTTEGFSQYVDYNIIEELKPDFKGEESISGHFLVEMIPPPTLVVQYIQVHRLNGNENLSHLLLAYHQYSAARAVVFVNTCDESKLHQDLLNTLPAAGEEYSKLLSLVVQKSAGTELVKNISRFPLFRCNIYSTGVHGSESFELTELTMASHPSPAEKEKPPEELDLLIDEMKVCLTERPENFRRAMKMFQVLENKNKFLKFLISVTVSPVVWHLLNPVRFGVMFKIDFPFYVVVAYRLLKKHKLYELRKETLRSFCKLCVEGLYALPPEVLQETLEGFINRGSFDAKFTIESEISVFEILGNGFSKICHIWFKEKPEGIAKCWGVAFLCMSLSMKLHAAVPMNWSRKLFSRLCSRAILYTLGKLFVFVGVVSGMIAATVYLFKIVVDTESLSIHSTTGFTPEQFNKALSYAVPVAAGVGAVSLTLELVYALWESVSQHGFVWKIWSLFQTVTGGAIIVALFSLSLVPLGNLDSSFSQSIPSAISQAHNVLDELSITSSYGLFRRMTGVGGRPELIIEGKNDEGEWREYDFLFKPGRIDEAPPFVAPHQPRLDWQMWFAALGTYQHNPWLVNLVYRLLIGQKEVMDLLPPPPFAEPPKFIRVQLYHYHYTEYDYNKPLLSQSGPWWRRELQKEYTFPLTQDHPGLEDYLKQNNFNKKSTPRCVLPICSYLDQLRLHACSLPPTHLLLALFSTALLVNCTTAIIGWLLGTSENKKRKNKNGGKPQEKASTNQSQSSSSAPPTKPQASGEQGNGGGASKRRKKKNKEKREE